MTLRLFHVSEEPSLREFHRWRQRVANGRVTLYELPPHAFRLHDITAGYWVAPVRVATLREFEIGDLPAEIARRDADLIHLPSLWPLFDAVTRSSVSYSAIRMRNAQPGT